MAVANSSSSATVKAVLLPLILVLLAMAAGASSTEDGPAVAKSGGRFSETPVARKLLSVPGIYPCGSGKAPNYNCAAILEFAKQPTCCTDPWTKTQACWDVGSLWQDKCGSCTTKCKLGSEVCCYGVCANLMTDKNYCGSCINKCRGDSVCKEGMCDY